MNGGRHRTAHGCAATMLGIVSCQSLSKNLRLENGGGIVALPADVPAVAMLESMLDKPSVGPECSKLPPLMDNLLFAPGQPQRPSARGNLNPYDPPMPALGAANDGASGGGDVASATFMFSPEHLVETVTRYRSQHLGRRIWRWVRCAAALMFLIVALVGLFIPQFIASAFMLALAVCMFFPHKIDDFLARRNFHKSPHCNTQQTIWFTDDGLRSKSEVQDSTLKWTAFSRAVIFNDGVLIFQGPKMVHWIPDNTLEHSGDAATLRRIVKSNVASNHAMQRSCGGHLFGNGDLAPAAR